MGKSPLSITEILRRALRRKALSRSMSMFSLSSPRGSLVAWDSDTAEPYAAVIA